MTVTSIPNVPVSHINFFITAITIDCGIASLWVETAIDFTADTFIPRFVQLAIKVIELLNMVIIPSPAGPSKTATIFTFYNRDYF